MKTASAKAKGRHAAKLVRDMMLRRTELKPDDIRVTPSGVTGEDLQLSPKAREMYPFASEVKNQESLNIWKSLEQAESHSTEYPGVLFFKRNRSEVYAALPAEMFIELVQLLDFMDSEVGGE